MSYLGKTGFIGSYKGRDVIGISKNKFLDQVNFMDSNSSKLIFINDIGYLIDTKGYVIGELTNEVVNTYSVAVHYSTVSGMKRETSSKEEAEIASPKVTTGQEKAQEIFDFGIYSKTVDEFFNNLK